VLGREKDEKMHALTVVERIAVFFDVRQSDRSASSTSAEERISLHLRQVAISSCTTTVTFGGYKFLVRLLVLFFNFICNLQTVSAQHKGMKATKPTSWATRCRIFSAAAWRMFDLCDAAACSA
jgi:hypothetical protein